MGFIAVSASATERGIAARRQARIAAPVLLAPPVDVGELRASACYHFHDRRIRQMQFERIRLRVIRDVFGVDTVPHRQTMQRIIRRICRATDTPEALVRGAGRNRRLVKIRHACMYWCRRLTGRSFPSIAKQFDDRDHTVAMYAVRTYPARRAKEGRFLKRIGGTP